MNLTTLNTHIITSRAVSVFLSDPPSTDDNDRLTVVPLQPFNLINNLKDIVVFLGFVSNNYYMFSCSRNAQVTFQIYRH